MVEPVEQVTVPVSVVELREELQVRLRQLARVRLVLRVSTELLSTISEKVEAAELAEWVSTEELCAVLPPQVVAEHTILETHRFMVQDNLLVTILPAELRIPSRVELAVPKLLL